MDAKERTKLENLVYARTHKDFKGLLGGKKSVLVFIPKIGTSIMFLSEMEEEELLSRKATILRVRESKALAAKARRTAV